MKTVVALPGQGIGVEVVGAACEIMTAAGMPVKIFTPPQSEPPATSHGSRVPEETMRACRKADAVLFGAAGPATSAVVGWLRWEWLEDAAAVEARIREAARHIPIERLAVSPQCGFASGEAGNPLTSEEQEAKLRLVGRVARHVWPR